MPNAADVSTSRSDKTVLRDLDRLERAVNRQAALIACISTLTEALVADKDAVLGSIGDLRQAIKDDQASDQAVVDRLVAANAALQKKIDDATAAGDAKEAADLQEIMDQITAAKGDISAVNDGSGTGTGGDSGNGETDVPVGG